MVVLQRGGRVCTWIGALVLSLVLVQGENPPRPDPRKRANRSAQKARESLLQWVGSAGGKGKERASGGGASASGAKLGEFRRAASGEGSGIELGYNAMKYDDRRRGGGEAGVLGRGIGGMGIIAGGWDGMGPWTAEILMPVLCGWVPS